MSPASTNNLLASCHNNTVVILVVGGNGRRYESVSRTFRALKKEGRSSGTALVVHAKADDMKSDPAGNAGDRIACGLITK